VKKIIALITFLVAIMSSAVIALAVYTAGNRHFERLQSRDEQRLNEAMQAVNEFQAQLANATAAAAAFEADAKNFLGASQCTAHNSAGAAYSAIYHAELVAMLDSRLRCDDVASHAKQQAVEWRVQERFLTNQVWCAEDDFNKAEQEHEGIMVTVASVERAGLALRIAGVADALLCLALAVVLIGSRKQGGAT
jgi:hypothetical protein